MTNSEQTLSEISELAKNFVQVVQQKCDKELDFSESSIGKLDEVVEFWQSMSKKDKLEVCDGMCLYLGEVIRRNLGGHWIEPQQRGDANRDIRCYLRKVAGVLTVSPYKWVRRCFLEGRRETFSFCYKAIKQKAKAEKKKSTKTLKNGSRFTSSGLTTYGIDRFTSIIALMQFLSVFIGWALCCIATRIGGNEGGLPGFLVNYGFVVALIPIIWVSLMMYVNSSGWTPYFFDKALAALGCISILVILGLFFVTAVGIIASAFEW